MNDAVVKDTDNEFIKEHVTDTLYNKIVGELSGRTTKKGTGRKISLTAEMLRQYLFYVSMGVDYKEAAESAGINERTRRDYAQRSETFTDVSSLAKQNVSLRARVAVAKAIMGTKPGYYQFKHPVTGNTEYIAIKPIEPNVQVAQWWLEKVDKIGGNDDSGAVPTLGAPRNEEEANLLLMLLNKHNDYVEAKRKQNK